VEHGRGAVRVDDVGIEPRERPPDRQRRQIAQRPARRLGEHDRYRLAAQALGEDPELLGAAQGDVEAIAVQAADQVRDDVLSAPDMHRPDDLEHPQLPPRPCVGGRRHAEAIMERQHRALRFDV